MAANNQPLLPPKTVPVKLTEKTQEQKAGVKPEPQKESGPRFTYSLKIKIGDLEFHNQRGDFLGIPTIDLATTQVGRVDFVVNEQTSDRNQIPKSPETKPVTPPNPASTPPATAKKDEPKAPDAKDVKPNQGEPKKPDSPKPSTLAPAKPEEVAKKEEKADPTSLWGRLKAQETAECQIELGFPGFLYNKLVGKLYRVGRRMPDGIILEIADMTVAAQGTSPTVTQSTDVAAPTTPTPATPEKPGDKPAAVSVTKPTESSKSQAQSLATAAAGASKVPPAKPSEVLAKASGLKAQVKTDAGTGANGAIAVNTKAIQSVSTEAAKVGDVVVVDGNTIKQVAPGAGTPTGIILDYNQHRNAIIRLDITKKTPNHLQGPGILGVQGWDVNGKQMHQGFAVTPGTYTPVPGGKVNVPEWGQIKISDPIFPGCFYTWGDATKDGNRVPHSKLVMQGIVEIAQQLMQLHQRMGLNGGKKTLITSWYRTPAHNAQFASGPNGPHTKGCAVDFWFEGYVQFYKKLDSSWQGGLAISMGGSGEFMHIDLGGASPTFQTSPKRRWEY